MTLYIEDFKTEVAEKQKAIGKHSITYSVDLPLNDIYEHLQGEDLAGYITQRILTKASSRDFDGIEARYVSDYIKAEIKAITFNRFHSIDLVFSKEEFNQIIKNIIALKLDYYDGLNDLSFSDYITYFMS